MAELIKDMIGGNEDDAEIFPLASKFLQCPYAGDFRNIVLDLSLPDIDGFELLERLSKKSTKWRVLIVSGHQDGVISAAAVYAESLGIQVIGGLHKPFSYDELHKAMNMAN